MLCGLVGRYDQHLDHVRAVIGQRAGITAAELAAIKTGPDADTWDSLDAAILRACDELVGNHFIEPATWTALAPLGDTGRVDLVYTVGQYTQVSMLLNSCGVQLDPGLAGDPDLG